MITLLLYKILKFKTRRIRYKNHILIVDIADSLSRQMLGLMYRGGLDRDRGMLFIFQGNSKSGIWMQNMKFAIDIIWLDDNGRVVDLVENAKPCNSMFNCPIYKPKKDSRYVLEVASGVSKKLGIRIGDKIPLN